MIRLTLSWFHCPDRRPTGWRRPTLLVFPICLVLLVAACGMPPRPTSDASREELEDFQHLMQDDSQKTDEYISITQSGKNISELTLGWFVYDILTELASQDTGLYDYFCNNHGNIQVYLKTRFKDHPLDEIAKIESLAKQGHPTLRLSARYALETLRHIPDSDEPAETQDRDRRELAAALAILRDLLEKSAQEAVFPRP